MIAIIISLLIPSILGFLVVSIILRDEADFLEKVSLSYPLGAGLVTMQMFIIGIMRIPFELWYLLPLFIAEIVILSFYLRKLKIVSVPLSFKLSPLVAIIISISIIKLTTVFLETFFRPIYAWDAWANWSAGAKLFYHNKGLLLDKPEEFLGKGYVLRIISYPLHNPLMQTWIALFAGNFDEVLVKFWSPLYLLSMSLMLYWLVKKESNELISSIVLIIFLSSPLLCYHSIEVYADLCLGAYIFFSTISFLYFMNGRKNYLPLIALFVAEGLFTKDEAIFFGIPLILSVIIYLLHQKSFKRSLFSLIPVIYILPWYIFKISNSLTIGAEFIKFDLTFHPDVLPEIIFHLLTFQNFNTVFIAFPLLLFLSGISDRKLLHILGPIIFYTCFFVSIYMFTSFYYEQFIQGTVFFRNMLTLYPAIMLLDTLLFMKVWRDVFQKGGQ